MSLANAVRNSKFLTAIFNPIVRVYPDLAGYRKVGLKYDDLISEENDVVVEALRRLPAAEQDARVFRIRRAFQCSLSHSELPKNEWITSEDDVSYLLPIIKQVELEFKERDEFEALSKK
jgi:ubiquinol-cytochrome c reductase subunit 7